MLDAHINRRRILQGALWATPAVVIATAAPAAAASVGIGSLVVASASATQNNSSLSVTATVAYGGGGEPVSGTALSISMPTSRVGLLEPSTASAGWSYQGRATSGATTTFTFTWNGAALSASNSATSPLVATLPKGYADASSFAVSLRAAGTSALTPVASPAVQLSTGAGPVAKHGAFIARDSFVIYDINNQGSRQGAFDFQARYSVYNDSAAFAGTGVEPWQAQQSPAFATWALRWRFQIIDPNGKVVDEDTGTATLAHDGTLKVTGRVFTTEVAGAHRGRLIFTSDQISTVNGVSFALKSYDEVTAPVTIS